MNRWWKSIKYLGAYLVPYGAFTGLYRQGLWVWSVVGIAFILIPLLELVLPFSKANPTAEQEEELKHRRFYDILLYLHVPLIYGVLFYYLHKVSIHAFTGVELAGATLSVGVVLGAMGINIAHELGHRNTTFERVLAKLLLLPNNYMHFIIEHNRGHHKNVSTPLDPASGRYNETLFHFWLRSVSRSYISAWHLEKVKLERNGDAFWSGKNEMLRFALFQLTFAVFIAWLFGGTALLFYLLVSLTGILLLETVNYIEHYGLQRRLLPEGIYETVKPTHSWNSSHELGRIFLFELTRHSDHHYKANRKYQVLRHFDESPQLPAGYPGSMLLALVPPLWFHVMNKRVRAIRHDLSYSDLGA